MKVVSLIFSFRYKCLISALEFVYKFGPDQISVSEVFLNLVGGFAVKAAGKLVIQNDPC